MSRNGWPMVPLGEVISHRKEFIQIDDLSRYKRCRVQLHAQGVVLRDEVEGSQIKTKKQQVCRTNEFLVAEIDAKMGGFGLVPRELEGAVVSSHYFLFAPLLDRLDPEFLGYYCRTPAFRDQVESRGTTNYAAIRPAHVLGYTIPLPPLEEQRRIVARIDRLAAKVEQAQSLRLHTTGAREAICAAATSMLFEQLAVSEVPIGDLGIDGSNPVQTGPFGAQLHKSEFTDSGTPVLNVGNVWPTGLRLDRLDHVSPAKAVQLARYRLQPGDLLFARSGATLGKVCVVPDECDGWLMTGHLFRVRFDHDRCDPAFAFVALRGARTVRSQVFDQVRGATRPGFNTTLLSRVRLPVPPLGVQRRLVAQLNSIQMKVNASQELRQHTAAELDALLPSILDRAFKGEL